MDRDSIVVVSGLPRSGTSMMMKMLEAGGLKVMTDNIRTADEDNPKGYYELEKVKELDKDRSWLENAKGKVVKIISALLQELPSSYSYKVIFMNRDMKEILASQRQMLIRRGEPTDAISDEKMADGFRKHLYKIKSWLDQQANMEVLDVNYNEVLKNPQEYIPQINSFLNNQLDEQKMGTVVDRSLYRQRN